MLARSVERQLPRQSSTVAEFSVSEVTAVKNDEHVMDIVIDSGPKSTARRAWSGDDLAVDERQMVELVDLQKRTVQSYSKRNMPLFSKTSAGRCLRSSIWTSKTLGLQCCDLVA